MDDKGVDFVNTDEFNLQAKNISKRCHYDTILGDMPEGELNIIVEKKTAKRGKRFMEQGRYVHMELSTFMHILEKLKKNEL